MSELSVTLDLSASRSGSRPMLLMALVTTVARAWLPLFPIESGYHYEIVEGELLDKDHRFVAKTMRCAVYKGHHWGIKVTLTPNNQTYSQLQAKLESTSRWFEFMVLVSFCTGIVFGLGAAFYFFDTEWGPWTPAGPQTRRFVLVCLLSGMFSGGSLFALLWFFSFPIRNRMVDPLELHYDLEKAAEKVKDVTLHLRDLIETVEADEAPLDFVS